MKKLLYLLALPIGMGLLWGFTVDVVDVPRAAEPNEVNLNKDLLALDVNPLWGKTIHGTVNSILQTNNQDTSKSQKQKDLEQQKKYEAFRKSPEFAKKIQEMKEVNGKTLTGVIGDDYEKSKTLIGKGKLFTAAGTTYILEGFTKGNILNTLVKNDEIVVNVDYSSFNLEVPHLVIAAKTISKQGKLLYTAAPRPEPKKHAFLYEANKARFAWSIIKSIHKNNDGTIEKIVLNDNGFTINLDVQDQKFKTKDFKVGSSVIVKFFGERLVAKNTYTTNKMIVLYSWPKKYELKNKTLFDKFYYEDGKQKIKEGKVVSTNSKTNTENLRPILISSTNVRVDTKNEISYVKNGRMEIYGGTLLADELTFDQKNKKVITQKATFTNKAGKVIIGNAITFDYGKGTYLITSSSESTSPSNKKAVQFNLDPIEYTASDSVKTNKQTGDIFLYGNAKFLSNNQTYESDRMVYNKAEQTLKVRSNVQVYDKMSKTYTKADSLDMNLKTGKGMLYGKVLLKYDR